MKKSTLLFAAALVALTPAQSFAHAFLDTAEPKVGGSVTTAPKDIDIIFTEEVEPAFSKIQLYAADGTLISTGKATVDPQNKERLSVPINTSLAPGHYEVRWNVVAVDTHRTNGHFTFDYQP